jgi:hypothetical protein
VVISAVERVRKADDEAHASALAWQLGPEVFLSHITGKVDKIRKRIEDDYHAASDGDGQPDPEADTHRGGGSGGGP